MNKKTLPGQQKLNKGWLALVFAVILAALHYLSTPESGNPEQSLKAATWNLCWFPSGHIEPKPAEIENQNIQAAAREIRKVEPHIICLQEIRNHEAAAALAAACNLPDFQVAVCTDFPYNNEPGLQQNAILTSFPVLETASERWRTVDTINPARGFAYALLDTPCGPVAVYSIHLKSNYIPRPPDLKRETPEERVRREAGQANLNRLQRELAADQLRAHAGHLMQERDVSRIIVAGDYNTSLADERWKDETTLTEFYSAGYRSCFEGMSPEESYTLPASHYYPAVTFDYIIHHGFSTQEKTRIHPKRWVSDHQMVSVYLECR